MLPTDLPRSKTTSIIWTTSVLQLERYCFTGDYSCRIHRIVKDTFLYKTNTRAETGTKSQQKKGYKHGILFSQLIQLKIHHRRISSDYTESSGSNNLSCCSQLSLVQDLVIERWLIFARGRSILPVRHIKTPLVHNYRKIIPLTKHVRAIKL